MRPLQLLLPCEEQIDPFPNTTKRAASVSAWRILLVSWINRKKIQKEYNIMAFHEEKH